MRRSMSPYKPWISRKVPVLHWLFRGIEISPEILHHGNKVGTLEGTAIVARAKVLLWVIARCDVEDINGHRAKALEMLRAAELRARELNIGDLYEAVLLQE